MYGMGDAYGPSVRKVIDEAKKRIQKYIDDMVNAEANLKYVNGLKKAKDIIDQIGEKDFD